MRGPGRNLLISLLVGSLFDRGFCKETRRRRPSRRAALFHGGSGFRGGGGGGGGTKEGKSCATGRAQLLVNYISFNDDECFSTRDAFG